MLGEFAKLRKAAIARDRLYPGADEITPSFRGVELAGEVGEACNVVKKLERSRLGIAGSSADVLDLAQELADVIICVDLLAMDYGIDLWPAVVAKFNASSTKLQIPVFLDGEDDEAGDHRVAVRG
jgi:NTP pyrophosphatase (non-canonical NTP hydrolase)